MNSKDQSLLGEAHGGSANGRQLRLHPDPTDPTLPAATITVQVDNHVDAVIVTAEYVRGEISDETHRWIYRPAGR